MGNLGLYEVTVWIFEMFGFVRTKTISLLRILIVMYVIRERISAIIIKRKQLFEYEFFR